MGDRGVKVKEEPERREEGWGRRREESGLEEEVGQIHWKVPGPQQYPQADRRKN